MLHSWMDKIPMRGSFFLLEVEDNESLNYSSGEGRGCRARNSGCPKAEGLIQERLEG